MMFNQRPTLSRKACVGLNSQKTMKTDAIQKLKEKHPDCLFILRSGDFYSLYGEDAKTASACLGLTLTKTADGVFQVLFRLSELDRYLPKLIRAGHRVAICDEP